MVTAHSMRSLFSGFVLAKEADGPSPRILEAYYLIFRNIVRDIPPEKLQNAVDLSPQNFRERIIDLREPLATATIDQRISKAKAFFNWRALGRLLDIVDKRYCKRLLTICADSEHEFIMLNFIINEDLVARNDSLWRVIKHRVHNLDDLTAFRAVHVVYSL